MSYSQAQYYLDTLLIATLVDDTGFQKQAQSGSSISGVISSLISTVKDYVSDKIDPNNRISSVFNLLASPMLMALGGRFTILGILLQIAEYLGFQPSKILGEIVDGLKSAIIPGQMIAPEKVDQIVDQATSANIPSQIQKTQHLSIREVQIYKIALLHFAANKSAAGITDLLLRRVFGANTVTASLLSRFLGWIVKTVLIAAGLMTGEAIFDHMTGKSPASSPSPPSSPSASDIAPAAPSTVQQIFKTNPGYNDETLNVSSGWIENTPPAQIGEQIVLWAQDIYPDLQGKNSFIESSPLFQQVVHYIQQYNSNNTTSVSFMPKKLTSRKQVVDLFIDDLANKVQQMSKSLPKDNPSSPSESPTTFV
jgi:hypothetical protein